MRSAIVRTDRYTRGAIAFHWVIAAAVLFNLWLGLFHESLPREWKVMPVHKATGITILVLSLARLAWRLTHRPPPLPADVASWERTVAHATHWTLYFLTIAMPLTGWIMASAGNPPRPLDWYGLFPIPHLPVGAATGEFGSVAHMILGYALAALAVLHILAALRHHLLLRDATLVRMLPVLRAPTNR